MFKKIASTMVITLFCITISAMQEHCFVLVRAKGWGHARYFSDEGRIKQRLFALIGEKNNASEPDIEIQIQDFNTSDPVLCGVIGSSCAPTNTPFISKIFSFRTIDCDLFLPSGEQAYHAREKLYLARLIAEKIMELKTDPKRIIHLITFSQGIELVAIASQLLSRKHRSLRLRSSQRSIGLAQAEQLLFPDVQGHLHAILNRSGLVSRDAPGEEETNKIISSVHTIVSLEQQGAFDSLFKVLNDGDVIGSVQHVVATQEAGAVISKPETHPEEQVTTVVQESSCCQGCLSCCTSCMRTTRDILTNETAQKIAVAVLQTAAQITLALV